MCEVCYFVVFMTEAALENATADPMQLKLASGFPYIFMRTEKLIRG